MADDFLTKALKSPAALSLFDEQAFCQAFETHGWSTVHSAYYTDSLTNKDRESDVVAHQRWVRKVRKAEERYYLYMLAEAKTLKDYTILASPPRKPPTLRSQTSYWVGYDEQFLSALRNRCQALGVLPEQERACRISLSQYCYPDEFAVAKSLLEVTPPEAAHYAGAFRETNMSSEKDMDNSVVWKAGAGLRSAFHAQCQRWRDWHLESAVSAN